MGCCSPLGLELKHIDTLLLLGSPWTLPLQACMTAYLHIISIGGVDERIGFQVVQDAFLLASTTGEHSGVATESLHEEDQHHHHHHEQINHYRRTAIHHNPPLFVMRSQVQPVIYLHTSFMHSSSSSSSS